MLEPRDPLEECGPWKPIRITAGARRVDVLPRLHIGRSCCTPAVACLFSMETCLKGCSASNLQIENASTCFLLGVSSAIYVPPWSRFPLHFLF